jgi:molecular chaperone DnaK (HSP70)
MNPNLHPVIGIDLGTTFSAVAAWNTALGQATVIPDPDHGDAETTPSVIGLEGAGQGRRRVIVGWDAKRNLPNDPRNTVIEIKREMGAVFSDESLARYGAVGRFQVHKPPPEPGKPPEPPDALHIRFAGQWLRPQGLSAFTLMRMKQLAEAEFGRPLHDAVITVPAYFKANQKKATEEAAKLAGLYPRQLIPEPTAAAICYGVDQGDPARRVYLVYDLGGGTFDVSIIEAVESRINVIATSGDSRLGGGDFDDRITAWAAAMLGQQFGIRVAEVEGIPDPQTGQVKYYVIRQPLQPDALARIKDKAEDAKIALSTAADTTLPLTFLAGPDGPPTLKLTRKEFLGLIEDLLARSVDYVNTALGYAREKGVQSEEISAVLLVGGSSKIPRVRELLMEHFRKDEEFVRNDADPDLVVARGAAIMARRFEPSRSFDIRKVPTAGLNKAALEDDIQVSLITEHSLGLRIQNNRVNKIIHRGSNIPISVKESGYINGGPTDYIDVEVYQGEGDVVYQNTMIGMLKIGPMEPREQGYHKFDVTFSLSTDGLLTTTIHHLNEGKNYQGRFDQASAIGEADLLAKQHEELRTMFTTGFEVSDGRQVTPAGLGPSITPVPPPTVPQVVPPQSVLPGATAGAGPTAGPAPGPATTATCQAYGPPPTADRAAAAPPRPIAADPATGADDGIPKQYRSIVRRVRGQLEAGPNDDLDDLLEEFLGSLRQNRPVPEVEKYFAALEKAYYEAKP